MTERQNRFIQLIDMNYSVNQIMKTLNITDSTLNRMIQSIKNHGFDIQNDFSIDGCHRLKISHQIHSDSNSISFDNSKKQEISFIAIADTHLLSEYADLKSLDLVYDFAKKNNIHYFFHLGDFVNSESDDVIKLSRSLKKLLEIYPRDDDITTFMILGNHDVVALEKNGYNISNVISSLRSDFVTVGIDKGTLNINRSLISLYHKVKPQLGLCSSDIILRGHEHIYKIKTYINSNKRESVMIHVPSLSNMNMSGYNDVLQKGFVKLDMIFNHDIISELVISQYFLDNKIVKAGEFSFQLRKIKNKEYI